MRREAAGYGLVYFTAEMLAENRQSLAGKACLVSGSGNVAQHAAEKLIESGARVLTLSDSSGYIYDEEGIDRGKLDFVKRLKNIRRARIGEYVEKYSQAVFVEHNRDRAHNPLWTHPADCAFPCATENEIGRRDAENLMAAGVKVIAEGATMPSSLEAVEIFKAHGVLYAPGKAANAGGVAVSGLEMAQNSMRLSWSREEVDQRLKLIMKGIHRTCLEVAEEFGSPGSYLAGANIAGFLKVVNAMLDQGLV
jgi:glutamate dehydrogenase (NADP+)